MSILGSGYGLSKYSPKKERLPTAVSSANWPCSLLPTGVQHRTVTPSTEWRRLRLKGNL
jgi:hypothetical protein